MRPIYLARGKGDKTRPVLILTREAVRSRLHWVTVAPITSTVKDLSIEVPVGPSNGLDHDSVVNCDNLDTIRVSDLGRHVGFLYDDQEAALTRAITEAFDLR
jgi:mRNA interferase MazF